MGFGIFEVPDLHGSWPCGEAPAVEPIAADLNTNGGGMPREIERMFYGGVEVEGRFGILIVGIGDEVKAKIAMIEVSEADRTEIFGLLIL
jgi:hypothetical protein